MTRPANQSKDASPTPRVVDAVYRKGAVVDARLELDHNDAMKTASELASAALTAKLEKALARQLSSKLEGIVVGASFSTQASVKSAHHPIVDYPVFVAQFEGQRALVRISLTVCRNQSKSKLWTRVSPLQADGNSQGLAPANDSLAFFDVARDIAAAAEPCAIEFYEAHLSKIAPRSISLATLHSIQVAAIDCIDGEAWRLLDAVRDAEQRGAPLKKLTEDRRFKYLWIALEEVFEHLTGSKASDLTYPTQMQPMRVEVDEDRKGFFFWKKGPGQSSSLVGLCPTEHNHTSSSQSHHTGRSVTALLINRLASSL